MTVLIDVEGRRNLLRDNGSRHLTACADKWNAVDCPDHDAPLVRASRDGYVR
jgi:hypothetical protein